MNHLKNTPKVFLSPKKPYQDVWHSFSDFLFPERRTSQHQKMRGAYMVLLELAIDCSIDKEILMMILNERDINCLDIIIRSQHPTCSSPVNHRCKCHCFKQHFKKGPLPICSPIIPAVLKKRRDTRPT